MEGKMQGTITRIEKETADINGFHIKITELDDEVPFSYIPGQYIMLAFPDDEDSKRAFSIVDFTPETMEIFVLLKKNGEFTQKMFASKVGQQLNVLGPYGKFSLPQQQESAEADMKSMKNNSADKVPDGNNQAANNDSADSNDSNQSESLPLVFIAGGIGITPIYSMIMQAHKANYEKEIRLFYSAKSPEHIPLSLQNNLNKVNNGRIKVRYNFTQDGKRLDFNLMAEELHGYSNYTYYICGPGAMIEDFRKSLLEKGVPEEQIRSEDFS